MSENLNLNLKQKSRNPSSMANDEHNDASGAQRSGNGDIVAVERIVPAAEATVAVNVPQRGTLRVANTAGTWAYLYVGDAVNLPPGAPDITNGVAIPPNSATMIYTGIPSSAMQSLQAKASAGTLQIVIMQQ